MLLGGGLPDQTRDDAPDNRETVRLLWVERPVSHGPADFDVKDFREPLRVVAHHHDLILVHFVKDVLAL